MLLSHDLRAARKRERRQREAVAEGEERRPRVVAVASFALRVYRRVKDRHNLLHYLQLSKKIHVYIPPDSRGRAAWPCRS